MRWRLVASLILAAASEGLTIAAAPNVTEKNLALVGVVVEEVGKGSSGEKAGIKPGDVLVSWESIGSTPADQKAARGRLASWFDFNEMGIEQLPRGAVRIEGLRDKASVSFEVNPGEWNTRGRCEMPANVLDRYLRARSLLDSKLPDDAGRLFREAWQLSAAREDRQTATFLAMRGALLLTDARAFTPATSAADFAIQEASPTYKAQVLVALHIVFLAQNDYNRAESLLQEAVRLFQQAGSESLSLGNAFHGLGNVARARGDLKAEEEFTRRALAIREKLAPDSLVVAASMNNLANSLRDQAKFAEAAALYEGTLAIKERYAGQSLDLARTLSNVAIVERRRGNLEAAEASLRRALVIQERVSPLSLDTARSLNNLANVLLDRGDLRGAQDLYERSCESRKPWN